MGLVSLVVGCGSTVSEDIGKGGDGEGGGSQASGSGSQASGTNASSSTGGPVCDAPSAPATYETGTGESCFERVTDLETLPVYQGPQGGFHLFTAVGCNDCGTEPIVEFGIKDPATMDWYANTYPQQAVLDLGNGPWFQRAGLTSFLPGLVYQPELQLPKGTHVILSASILTATGDTIHTQEFEVILGDTQTWEPPCDENADTCGKPGANPCCGLDGQGG